MLPTLLLVLLIGSASCASDISCRDTDGSPVDWFVALKKPKSLAFAKVTSASHSSWQYEPESKINETGPVFASLQQAFSRHLWQNDSADTVLLGYNDESPRHSLSFTKAHMKGVVLFSGNKGLWLVHSVPKFPEMLEASRLVYPHSGFHYGQSFFCISFDASELDKIGKQLWVAGPAMYNWRVSKGLTNRYPSWALLHKGKLANVSKSTVDVRTAAGDTMRHFAKSGSWRHDLYDSIVAPQLKQSLYVETWQHGTHLLNSSCSAAYSVLRVTTVASSIFGSSFSAEKDHSKWCASVSASSRTVCIGDMNRAESQFLRGGGTLCIRNQQLHSLFTKAVQEYQHCNQAGFYEIEFLLLIILTLLVIIIIIGITACIASLLVMAFKRRACRCSYQKI